MLISTASSHLTTLACLGERPPLFREALHVGRPNLPDRHQLHQRLDDMLDRRWLANFGSYAQAFEAAIATTCGCAHAVSTCNGTMGLMLLAKALNLQGEVIVPAFTFAATAHALAWLGLDVVLVDVDRHRHHLDPRAVAAAITPRTSAILGVHLWGRPCPHAALQALAQTHRLPLIYDAAHAFGSAGIGHMGTAAVLSFHATKLIGAGEGGAVICNDPDLAHAIRCLSNFGFDGNRDAPVGLGINGKLDEFSAAFGLGMTEVMPALQRRIHQQHCWYRHRLHRIPGLHVCRGGPGWNHHYLVMEVDPEEFGLNRDYLQQALHAEGILAKRYFSPGLHRVEPYRSKQYACPTSDLLSTRLLQLPLGGSIDDQIIHQISEVFMVAHKRASELRSWRRSA
jgi:dTDP-4-amino-4,6-dideoxy-D-glucose transaminase